MAEFFSDEMRRNPFPLYAQMRAASPLVQVPPPFNGWMLFRYDDVKRALSDHETFSSRVPAPKDWFIFFDPPSHTKQRALISRAFTPRMITQLEPRIRQLSAALLDRVSAAGEVDIVSQYAIPLPMQVIAGMLGMPAGDLPLYQRWSDVILTLSYSRSGGEEAERAHKEYRSVTEEMRKYLEDRLKRATPSSDDLLSSLAAAEIDGERLAPHEILGFFQLLVVAGQETTSDLISNSLISLLEHPDQFALLRANRELLPSAIEEVLRYRSPLQWMMRTPTCDLELHGRKIPAGAFLLAVIGSANRDGSVFADPDRFDIRRENNPHLAFGHGIHFCLGAALSRLETRIALTDLLDRFESLELASTEPWPPRKALHVHGPARLPLKLRPVSRAAAT